MGKNLVEKVTWGMYEIIAISQGVRINGVEIDPKNASNDAPHLNYAAARRLTGRKWIGKSLTITDPVKVKAILDFTRTPAGFVDDMKANAAERKAGKVAIAAIKDLEAKMAALKGI